MQACACSLILPVLAFLVVALRLVAHARLHDAAGTALIAASLAWLGLMIWPGQAHTRSSMKWARRQKRFFDRLGIEWFTGPKQIHGSGGSGVPAALGTSHDRCVQSQSAETPETFVRARVHLTRCVPCWNDEKQARFVTYHGATHTIGHTLDRFVRGGKDFCIWFDESDPHGGPSVTIPWRWLRAPGYDLVLTSGTSINITRRRGVTRLRSSDPTCGEFTLRPSGLANAVILERGGQVIARFPAFTATFTADVDALSASERVLLLAVVGSGLPRRVRHLGIVAEGWGVCGFGVG